MTCTCSNKLSWLIAKDPLKVMTSNAARLVMRISQNHVLVLDDPYLIKGFILL